MRRLEIHSNHLILAKVEEGATGAPKPLPLGSRSSFYPCELGLTPQKPTTLKDTVRTLQWLMHEEQLSTATKIHITGHPQQLSTATKNPHHWATSTAPNSYKRPRHWEPSTAVTRYALTYPPTSATTPGTSATHCVNNRKRKEGKEFTRVSWA